MSNSKWSPNSVAFIAMSVEYCHALENVLDFEREDFIAKMLKLLPRIYMSATDIAENQFEENYYAESYLEEESYDAVKENIARLLAEDDIYLEVFMDDMKYSDTPLSASISENLADIYQALYNLAAGVKDATNEAANEVIANCKADFETYWGQTLCNVLRALHSLRFNPDKINY